jgi:hypothetical protein
MYLLWLWLALVGLGLIWICFESNGLTWLGFDLFRIDLARLGLLNILAWLGLVWFA